MVRLKEKFRKVSWSYVVKGFECFVKKLGLICRVEVVMEGF